jgi:hypothetical protein
MGKYKKKRKKKEKKRKRRKGRFCLVWNLAFSAKAITLI